MGRTSKIAKVVNSFSDLVFQEEGHKYFVDKDGERINIKKSVSDLVKNFSEEFDTEKHSPRVALKKGISQEEVIASWDSIKEEALSRGRRVHSFAEEFPLRSGMIPICPQEKAVVKFWKNKPDRYVLVSTEKKMYHYKKLFAGTADLVFWDRETDSFIIGDYKTNKDLFKNFAGQRMFSPFEDKLDHPFSHYELQLSYYQILLEQLDIVISRRFIVWLKLDGDYAIYDTEDLTQKLKESFSKQELEDRFDNSDW